MFILLFSGFSLANADCDVKALSKSATSGAGDSSAEAFSTLLSCDSDAAKKISSSTISQFVPSETSYKVVIESLQAGLYSDVEKWIAGLQSDEKPLALRFLGNNCSESAVENFFVEEAKALGDAYWDDRWYKYTTTCKGDANVALLESAVRKKEEMDRTRYFAVLTAYARTAGDKSVPLLQEQLTKEGNEEVQMQLIAAFSDAAGVGSASGVDSKVASQAATIIVEHAEKYGSKALIQARTTLNILQDEEKADSLAGFAYKDVLQEDDSLLWGVIAVENGTCKKDKKKQQVHSAPVKDMGKSTWNDELQDHVQAVVETQWDVFFTLDSKCGTDYNITYLVPSKPFASMDEYQKWVEKTLPTPEEGVKQKQYVQSQIQM